MTTSGRATTRSPCWVTSTSANLLGLSDSEKLLYGADVIARETPLLVGLLTPPAARNERAMYCQGWVRQSSQSTHGVTLSRLPLHKGEWQEVWKSGVLRVGQESKLVECCLSDADELRLYVTDGGDGYGCDHAFWADARLQ